MENLHCFVAGFLLFATNCLFMFIGVKLATKKSLDKAIFGNIFIGVSMWACFILCVCSLLEIVFLQRDQCLIAASNGFLAGLSVALMCLFATFIVNLLGD